MYAGICFTGSVIHPLVRKLQHWCSNFGTLVMYPISNASTCFNSCIWTDIRVNCLTADCNIKTLWFICVPYNSKSSPKANFITYDASFTLEHKRHHRTLNMSAPLCLLLDHVQGEWQPHTKTLAKFSLILHAPKGRQVVQEMHASCSLASYWKAADHQMLHTSSSYINMMSWFLDSQLCVTADCLATLLKVQAVTKS